MTTDYIHDLDWLAFCYAAGELDAGDAELFEARLADDQAAREALARAVELTQTVAAAETQCGDLVTPATRTNLDWNRRLSWMAIGGLASVLVALLWSGFVGPTWHTAQHRLKAQSRYQLAMAWNQTRDEFADVREAALWLPLGSDTNDDASWGFMSDDEVVAEAPSWMTAAVFIAPRDADGTNQSLERPENE
jgi:hypothetical protein